jgi:hypothetical protein
MANSMDHVTTKKTQNGSDWPMNYAEHTQSQMDYAWRSPGSYTPVSVAHEPRHAALSPHMENWSGNKP